VKRFLPLGLLAAAVIAGAGVTASGADFVAASHSTGNTFGAASDFNTVAVSMTDPGSPQRGTVALQATASSERGIERVRFQSSPTGAGSWTDACEDTAAPFTCDWDSAGVADGARDLRAVAVDQAGYQRTATVAARVIDNTLPTAALADPGVITGTEVLTATGSDATSGLATLSIAHRPAGGGSWTELCMGSTSPRSCPLNSSGLSDGAYELRARATDAAGNERDTVITRTVDNTAPSASIPALGAARGTITVPVTAADGAGSGVNQVTIQIRPNSGGSWTNLCAADTAAPWECAGVDTTTRTDGLYDLQAIVVDNANLQTTSAVTTFRIDNTIPATATLANPGASLQGSVTLSGTATDGGSGIASWTAQYRLTGSTTWLDACTDTTSAYSCSWDTTGTADGVYELRAVATDQAGNQRAATTQTNKRVDNVVPAVALTNPGSPLTGTVTLNATASDGGGVASVVFERSPAGANTWTTICTDASAAYSCSFNTTAVADSAYDLRARATDNFGRTASSMVASRVVDNAMPSGVDVQTPVVGSITGQMQVGDAMALTFSEPMDPSSILTGWTGASQPIRVNLTNNANNDRIDFWNAANTARLDLTNTATSLPLGGNFLTSATGAWDATMVQSGNTITITLTALVSGTMNRAATGTMRWSPSAEAVDLAGNATSTTQVTESGGSDRDF
jgi:Bacterial Ig domain